MGLGYQVARGGVKLGLKVSPYPRLFAPAIRFALLVVAGIRTGCRQSQAYTSIGFT